jgi:hypothetical protein
VTLIVPSCGVDEDSMMRAYASCSVACMRPNSCIVLVNTELSSAVQESIGGRTGGIFEGRKIMGFTFKLQSWA